MVNIMTKDEFGEHYHKMRFELLCHEKQGVEFQNLFEKIMKIYDSSFLPVKPMGREGDWKCDGYSQKTGTVYQCYAPEKLNGKKAADKVKEDFEGAKLKWGSDFKEWVFVWSAYNKLPVQTVKMIQNIRRENPEIIINDWNTQKLWGIVLIISPGDRDELLGQVPNIADVTEITSAEIQVLLNYLIENQIDLIEDTIDFIGLEDKINRNKLNSAVQYELQVSMPLVRVVNDYLKKNPDSNYSLRVGSILANKYQILIQTVEDTNELFYFLVNYVIGNNNPARSHWASVGIISYYFQLCDIFER